MLDPCCEQAVLEEEGACPGVRMPCGGSGRIRRNCRRGLELAAASPNSQLLGEFLVLCPTAGAGKETLPQGHLHCRRSWPGSWQANKLFIPVFVPS